MTSSDRLAKPTARAVVQPVQEFLATESAGGALLLVAAIAALVWVNAPGGESYQDFWKAHVAIGTGALTMNEPVRRWVNDGLMAIFFFVVGLEIKRELLLGELADRKSAALPIAAALGGMIVPALIYLAFNADGSGALGWGIPMATDIAFAVGVLALLGERVPASLKVFLLALAIVDDIGAIVVIAVFYTDAIDPGWLTAAVCVFALTAVAVRVGVRNLAAYIAVGIVGWVCVHESGVHATIAGVVLGLLAPLAPEGGHRVATGADSAGREPAMYRLEGLLHPWTSYAIVPVFALANAGVPLGSGAIGDAVTSRVALGVVAGLMLGKPIGISAFAFLAVRAGLATLPSGVRWSEIIGVSLIAGIGFTVSLFITDLAFRDAVLIDDAKIAILAGSTAIGALGLLALFWMRPPATAREGG